LISGLVLFLKGVDMNDHCSLCYYLTSVSCNVSDFLLSRVFVFIYAAELPKAVSYINNFD